MLEDKYSKFFALDEQKQKKIINAAMKEFVQKGYEAASTNIIVADSNISKGSLFHYFTSKKELYIFLYKYTVDIFVSKIINNMGNLSGDVFERWKEVSIIKLKVIGEYPLFFEFVLSLIQNENMMKELEPVQSAFMQGFAKDIHQNIDYSLFKEDIDIQKALKVTWWTLEGFAKDKQQEVMEKTMNVEKLGGEILDEANEYLDILKKAFYK